MTTEQAGNILALLNAGFPREALERPTASLFVSEIELLADYDSAVAAARTIVRQGDRFPSIKDLRAAYRTTAEARRAETPALPEGRETRVPEWVQVWRWARAHGDERAFPQQDEQRLAPATMAIGEYQQQRDEWLAAGAPGIGGVGDPLRMMAA